MAEYKKPKVQVTGEKEVDARYCSKCGSELEPKRIHIGYDTDTGEPRYNILWECPMIRIWDRIFGGHAHFSTDWSGKYMLYE